ncbi:MAG: thioredoxin fold domain-containing protein [Geobacteraceae bacterium]|nr:thioredoxin fold domain-containing protein [Geobacteraceae bacterium]
MRTAVILLILSAIIFVQSPAGAADLDLGKAITIGNGPKTVIEFTDPDCPFCRKASKYFETRRDVTRHVFFFPLPRHLKAKEKIQYILSQPDRAGAYQEIMSGRMDSISKFDRITPKGIKLQEEQLDIAKKHKIDSTPTFMINGRIIEGFDLKKIEEALGSK